MWAGLAVDNTAETTATGYLFSDEAGKIAVLVKSTRNALIGFVGWGFALYWAVRWRKPYQAGPPCPGEGGVHLGEVPEVRAPGLLGRLGRGDGWAVEQRSARQAWPTSPSGLSCHVRRCRLNTDIRQIARSGWRPLAVAVIGLVVVAAVSLGLVLLTSRVLTGAWAAERGSRTCSPSWRC